MGARSRCPNCDGTKGHVYLAWVPSEGLFKVGCTKNAPCHRITRLSWATQARHELIQARCLNDPVEAERILHEVMDCSHLRCSFQRSREYYRPEDEYFVEDFEDTVRDIMDAHHFFGWGAG